LPIPFPLLTKPLNRAGGIGIHRFEGLDSLRAYLSDTDQRYNQLPIILQEFIEGDDIDFNGYAVGGEVVAWSIQRHIACESAPGSGLSGRQFVCEERVFDLGRRIVRAANYEGPLHVDMRISRQTRKLYAIEVNPRFWESVVASICDGVNFGDVAVQAAFSANRRWSPKCSGTIWGNPKAALKNWLRNRNRNAFNYLRRHSLFQLRHILHQKKIESHLAMNRSYDPLYQEEIVELIHRTGLPLQQAARLFNVTQELLEQWLTAAAPE
jgi:predicted ATP-grasp superfamily ATP-dependent carboligase